MNIADIFWVVFLTVYTVLVAIWLLWSEYRRAERRREEEGGEERPPSRPPRPPPRERASIEVEELTLVIQEPSKYGSGYQRTTGIKVAPEAESVVPVAKLRVNNKDFVGKILPLTFRILNSNNGRTLYESSIKHELTPDVNTIFPPDVFPIKEQNIRRRKEFDLELLASTLLVASTKFVVRKDVLKDIKGKQLTGADGELTEEGRQLIREIARGGEPDKDDLDRLIDETI